MPTHGTIFDACGHKGTVPLSSRRAPSSARLPGARPRRVRVAGRRGAAGARGRRRRRAAGGRVLRRCRARPARAGRWRLGDGPCREPTAVALLDRGAKVAVLCGRERVLEVYDARTLERLGRTGAGIGPVGLATDGVQLLYVTDVEGDALLVFHLRPRFELIRRVHVIGGPYAISFDKARWELTLTLSKAGKTVRYAAGNRPVWRETCAADGEQPGADEQPAPEVAVVVQAAGVVEVAVALAADRAPEHQQHQQRQARGHADVVDAVRGVVSARGGRAPSTPEAGSGRAGSPRRRTTATTFDAARKSSTVSSAQPTIGSRIRWASRWIGDAP